ncbi:hypothetical protein ACFQ1Q_03015 [Winogradskyella litorisediminis]|uniref:Lipocalin-like domain-containing protein n=1 Tax=Winogradskyella litorisediminis TaxID=1156618 RepID=A0ABW3N4E7_9FLAO
MKSIKILILAVLALTLNSCGDDDSPGVELTSENLAGTYDITFLRSSYEETVTASNGTTFVSESGTTVGDTFTDAIWQFNTNGTYSVSGSYRVTETTTSNGQTETDTYIDFLDDSGSFILNNMDRTIVADGLFYDVTVFDGTNLYLTFEETDTFGNEVEVSRGEIRLVKQQ